MSTLSANPPETYTHRYEALLRMAKAMGVCNDCDGAANVLTKELSEVASFDYLHLVTFENAGRVPAGRAH